MTMPTLFVHRDGTLIEQPADCQIDTLSKVRFMPGVFGALDAVRQAGYALVMVTDQDGLGTPQYPRAAFDDVRAFVLDAFSSQGIRFDAVLVCPRLPSAGCGCREPTPEPVSRYLIDRPIDRPASAVVGNRETDLALAENLSIRGCLVRRNGSQEESWPRVVRTLLARRAEIVRKTSETRVHVRVDLDQPSRASVETGIGFFDHMLAELATHGGFALDLSCQGDLEVDEHHTVEDSALALGEALRKALGSKEGIARYGFLLPMDEAEAVVSLDLSGRPFARFNARFAREAVGRLPTELVPHFFRSLSQGMGAAIHVTVRGENTHHMVEVCFKGVGRALRQAFRREGRELPSTKGIL